MSDFKGEDGRGGGSFNVLNALYVLSGLCDARADTHTGADAGDGTGEVGAFVTSEQGASLFGFCLIPPLTEFMPLWHAGAC